MIRLKGEISLKMSGAAILLEMLKLHGIKHVFGLPGETTLAWYRRWAKDPGIKHVLTHDERSAAFMAEAYAKVTGSIGVSEAPSPGGSHPVPGVLESFVGSVPTICLTSDVPYNCDKRNMLSGFDQNKLYSAITKETILVTSPRDIPFIIRRACRVALSDRPGAVHIRIPMNVYDEEADVNDLYADPCAARWPAYRPIADMAQIETALKLLSEARRPVIVCGQGALVSGAGEAVAELAELLGIPVGCTMTGKGTISETHPLSIRVIGARGGTSYSNAFLADADMVFFVGSNTDSAGTDAWKLPRSDGELKVAHLNISGIDAANNYRTEAVLVGDASATVKYMVDVIKSKGIKGRAENGKGVPAAMRALDDSIAKAAEASGDKVNPIKFVKALERLLPDRSYIVLEASTASIYSAAYFVQKSMGRKFLSNYTSGALGYSIPAAVGAAVAHPDHTVVGMGGDGSFHFNCGEFETYARLGANIKMLLFRNNVFGWIKGETAHVYKADFFATDFGRVDYAGVARSFGIEGHKIESSDEIDGVLLDIFSRVGPALVEVNVDDESNLVPPIPRWIPNAREKGIPYNY
jgi:acetolactate synthase-1/2/3 large subunit